MSRTFARLRLPAVSVTIVVPSPTEGRLPHSNTIRDIDSLKSFGGILVTPRSTLSNVFFFPGGSRASIGCVERFMTDNVKNSSRHVHLI